jgi:exopolysaccharide biosynthesis operon protein EpsL
MSIARSGARPLALSLCIVVAASAIAGPNDALHLYAGLGYGHDDNLLRVPDNFPGFDNTRADSWWSREGGLIFDKTYSLQRISLIAKLSKYDFDHFKQLDYDGKDVQTNWYWQIGNHLEGKLGAAYTQTLAPYTDFTSDQRNLRRSRSRFAEGSWRLHPAWRVRAGFQRDVYAYELLGERFNNRNENTNELELDYIARSASTVGLVARRVKGHYPFPRPIGQRLLNDDFTQDELKARVKWNVTGSSNIDALIGYTRRDQPSYGPGKTSGAAGRINLTHQTGGKMSYTAAAWHDFAPLESTLVSYTLNDGAAVGAQWDATAKIRVNADYSAERRNYNARQASALSGAGELRDSIRTGSLRATWTARPLIQVTAGVAHQARSGSPIVGTGSFASTSMTLAASAQF